VFDGHGWQLRILYFVRVWLSGEEICGQQTLRVLIMVGGHIECRLIAGVGAVPVATQTNRRKCQFMQ
jgi:hypothetical protein